jgi:hypothetical protein
MHSGSGVTTEIDSQRRQPPRSHAIPQGIGRVSALGCAVAAASPDQEQDRREQENQPL